MGTYEAYIVADNSRFDPSTLTIPAGSTVTFSVRSSHFVRGFAIAGTGVYMTAGPGWSKVATHEFDTPDTYLLVCSEYCGLALLNMHAIVKVQ